MSHQSWLFFTVLLSVTFYSPYWYYTNQTKTDMFMQILKIKTTTEKNINSVYISNYTKINTLLSFLVKARLYMLRFKNVVLIKTDVTIVTWFLKYF